MPIENRCIAILFFFLWGTLVTASAGDQDSRLQEAPSEPVHWVPTTVCELTEKGSWFNGKPVTFHAAAIGGSGHGIILVDERCKKGVRLDATESVTEQDDYRSFLRALLEEARTTGTTHRGLTAKFCGIFDYRPKETRLKWWLLVERISDVHVKSKKTPSGAEAEEKGRWPTFRGSRNVRFHSF